MKLAYQKNTLVFKTNEQSSYIKPLLNSMKEIFEKCYIMRPLYRRDISDNIFSIYFL